MTTITSNGKHALDAFIEETEKSGQVPAFVVGVSNVDEEIYFNCGGFNVVNDPSSGKVTPDSIFWICSQTKFVASVAALILIDQGKLSVDTPVYEYFPQLRNPIIFDSTTTKGASFRPAKNEILVKHLLNQSSGMFYPGINERTEGSVAMVEVYADKETHAAADPVSDFISRIIGDLPGFPILFEPGTDFVYGFSCDFLGFIVEKISGLTLEEFCQVNIFKPLAMDSASFLLKPELRSRLIDLAFRAKDGSLHRWADQIVITEQDPEKVKVFMGGVGIYCSMRDYLKLLRHVMQINAGVAVENPILKQETVKQMFVPALSEKGAKSLSAFNFTPGSQWGTAMAICTQDIPDGRREGTIYWGGWAGTSHFIDPESGIAGVIGTQVAPNGDLPWIQTSIKLSQLLYSALDKAH
ncbi:beta-lactamase/transpeptidase-like protein [Agrocybe pediades]|nr:beta-lactamase/transpeptidase-like protein [Agrocybe pediades]